MNLILLGRTVINMNQVAYIRFEPNYEVPERALVVFSACNAKAALFRELGKPQAEELKRFLADKVTGNPALVEGDEDDSAIPGDYQ
jgi:hypothetical protein